MRDETWREIDDWLEQYPEDAGGCTSDDEASRAERALGIVFAPDYRAFLLRYGAARLGARDIFGTKKAPALAVDFWSVVDVTKWFRHQKWPKTNDMYVVSMDNTGCPICMASDGRVYLSMIDLGAIDCVADSFEDYVIRYCF
jgi:hypothetical protein